MTAKTIFSALIIASGFTTSLTCFANGLDETTADKLMTPCRNYAFKNNTSVFRDFSSTTTCGVPFTVLYPSHLSSTMSNELFHTHLAQADVLARKSLSGSRITFEEQAVIGSTLKLLAESQIISTDAAVIGENGLSAEQLNLIIGVAGALQSANQ